MHLYYRYKPIVSLPSWNTRITRAIARVGSDVIIIGISIGVQEDFSINFII
jgi:hypothetical protein